MRSLGVGPLMHNAQAALAAGKCVVIGLQSTGEARTLDVVAERAVDGELDDFVSGPKARARAPCPASPWEGLPCAHTQDPSASAKCPASRGVLPGRGRGASAAGGRWCCAC